MLQEAGVVAKEPARGKYRRRRERRPLVGILVHLEASTHQWIAGAPTQDLCPRFVGIWLPAEDSRTSISGFRAWRPALDEMATFQPSSLFYESAASQRFAAGHHTQASSPACVQKPCGLQPIAG